MKLLKDQRGLGHVVEIVIIAVIILGVGGFIAWRMLGQNDSSGGNESQSALQQAIANATCDYDDKDLCKFMTSWRLDVDTKLEMKQTLDGQTTTSTFVSANKGKNTHVIMEVGGVPYESIVIDNATRYTKGSDGTWWKEVIEQAEATDTVKDYEVDFEEPADNSAAETRYEKLGTEPCGNLTCFKYQIIDPNSPSYTQYIWFDTQSYQLRRMLTQDSDYTTEATYTYENASVNVPNPVKDLPEGYYLVPGNPEPVVLPSAGDFGL